MQGDRGYRRNALRNAKALLTTSGWLRTQLARLVPERPVHLVPNGVGAPDWPAEAVEDISEARPMKVLFAGMLNWAKGPMELIEALPDLEACGFDYQLVFAGRGPLAGPIQKRAKQLGLPDRVDVIGHLDRNELVRLFAHAAIVVCPSLWPEPFGRIPLEAGLLGKPVIAYDIAGYRETIIPGRTGLLVPHADRKELAASIAELICDGTRRAELGVAARAHVRTSFSPQQSAYELEAAWRSVLKG
jgi:glycosyltransferase involved in cell wall biosynthesis